VPETKIAKLKKELKAIKAEDANRFQRLMSLGLQIAELEQKAGNQNAALLMLKSLDKQVHEMPPSLTRSQYLARISKHYSMIGRTVEGEALFNQVIAELEEHVEFCNKTGNLAAMEPASLLLVKLCRDIPDKRDHALAQYNRLVPAYIYKQNYNKAERMCNDALSIIRASNRSGDPIEISMLQFLATTQRKQNNVAEAEATMLQAWDLVQKGWAIDSPMCKAVGLKLVELYMIEGKNLEADKIKAAIR
jgi:tetratricopeptide (TPR) repeat protein